MTDAWSRRTRRGARARRTLRRTALVLALVTPLSLAGCTGAESAAAPSSTDSPLSRYLTPLYGYADADAAEQSNRQIEFLTAACMSERGFDYVPADGSPSIPPGAYQPDDPSWVARWGYGITEYPDVHGDVATYQPAPNDVIVAALDGAQAGAWYAALYGDGERDSSSGCAGSARTQVLGRDVTADPANQPIVQALDDFTAALFSDPELLQIDSDWARCMQEAGERGFLRQADASTSVSSTVQALRWTDEAGLQEEHRREVELALTDLDCRQQVDYTPRFDAVQFARETEFIESHVTALDDLIAQARTERESAAAENARNAPR